MAQAAAQNSELIRIEGLTHYYPGQPTAVLQGVDLRIARGSVFGLLGPNGAGKTTLISILLGLQQGTQGTLFFDGLRLEENLSRVRAMTGFVPQDLAFYPMLTVAENLNFYVRAFGINKPWREQRIEQALVASKLEPHLRKPAHSLSGGLKRRLNLAIGLLNNPQVLFLDEPTVGIDPQSRNFILETITRLNREQGMTVIYTSHYMKEVEQICDHIAIIDAGRILIQGELQGLLEASRGLQLIFSLMDNAPEAVRSELAAMGIASRDGRHFISEDCDEVSSLLSRLMPLLARHGLVLNALHYGQSSLEALYMKQTDSAPRE